MTLTLFKARRLLHLANSQITGNRPRPNASTASESIDGNG